MRRIAAALTLCLLALSHSRGWGQPKAGRQVARETFPSVVLLVMNDSAGQPTALGSGFVIGSELLVTNQHVIADATSGYARVVGQRSKYQIRGTVAVDTEHDLAIVSVQGLVSPALRLGDSSQIAVGDEVYAVGNPQGLEGTFSQGIISAIRRTRSGTVIQMTAPISPGSSGGPVVDAEGKVIGVAVATFKGGQNLNLAIPVERVTALKASISATVMPLTGQRGRSQIPSVLDEMGGPSVGGLVGENFAWDSTYLGNGEYSFTLRNLTHDNVDHVQCLVVFLDPQRRPLDVDMVDYSGVVPAGLARRVTGKVDLSVQKLTHFQEFRILDFRVAQ